MKLELLGKLYEKIITERKKTLLFLILLTSKLYFSFGCRYEKSYSHQNNISLNLNFIKVQIIK